MLQSQFERRSPNRGLLSLINQATSLPIKRRFTGNSQNPTATITGASSGSGSAATRRSFSQGWNVCMIARSCDEMKQIATKHVDDVNEDRQVKFV